MASVAVKRSDLFPVGTTVKAYLPLGRVTAAKPSGPSQGEAVVDATGKLEIAVEGRFVLAAEVAGAWVQLVADSREFFGRGTLQERVAARRVANGVIY